MAGLVEMVVGEAEAARRCGRRSNMVPRGVLKRECEVSHQLLEMWTRMGCGCVWWMLFGVVGSPGFSRSQRHPSPLAELRPSDFQRSRLILQPAMPEQGCWGRSFERFKAATLTVLNPSSSMRSPTNLFRDDMDGFDTKSKPYFYFYLDHPPSWFWKTSRSIRGATFQNALPAPSRQPQQPSRWREWSSESLIIPTIWRRSGRHPAAFITDRKKKSPRLASRRKQSTHPPRFTSPDVIEWGTSRQRGR
jgi:hypothetical protein